MTHVHTMEDQCSSLFTNFEDKGSFGANWHHPQHWHVLKITESNVEVPTIEGQKEMRSDLENELFFFFAESFEYTVEYGGPKKQNLTLPKVATAHVGSGICTVRLPSIKQFKTTIKHVSKASIRNSEKDPDFKDACCRTDITLIACSFDARPAKTKCCSSCCSNNANESGGL